MENYKTVFGYEEALGYMCYDIVNDKDGVGALCYFAEMTFKLYKNNQTIKSQLCAIYEKYGYFVSNNSYLVCQDPLLIKRVFDDIRFGKNREPTTNSKYEHLLKYPKEIGGIKVVYIRDLSIGYDSNEPDNIPLLPTSSLTQMITFRYN